MGCVQHTIVSNAYAYKSEVAMLYQPRVDFELTTEPS